MTPDRAPSRLRVRDGGRELVVEHGDQSVALAAEYLRVFSPSAEVRGHGGGEPQLVGGKRAVRITKVEPVGRYAVRLVFDDGHDTGLYSWAILAELANDQAANWSRYLQRLEAYGMTRDAETNVLHLDALAKLKKS